MKMTTSVTSVAASAMVCALLLLQCASTLGATHGPIEGRELECCVCPPPSVSVCCPCDSGRNLDEAASDASSEMVDANLTLSDGTNATNTTNATDEQGRELGICEQMPYGCPGRKLLKVTRMLLAEEADAMPQKDGDAAAPDAFQMRPKRPGALLANMTMDANTTTAANTTATANGTDEEGRDLMSCPCYEPGWPPSPACC